MDQLRYRPISRYFLMLTGTAAVIAASVVLSGWLLDIPVLARFHPSFIMMKVNAALGLLLLGFSALILGSSTAIGPWRRRAVLAGSLLVTAIGVLTLSEYFLGWDPGINELIMRDAHTPAQDGAPGRVSINTAICFTLLGPALAWIVSRFRKRYWISQGLILVAWLISLAAVVGHAYGVVNLFFRIGTTSAIAPHTAFLLLLLSSAFLSHYPGEGFLAALTRSGPGGYLFRRQLVYLIPFTFILGGPRSP